MNCISQTAEISIGSFSPAT